MTDKPLPSALTALFAQPVTAEEILPEGLETAHPAITAINIQDMLIRIGVRPLVDYINRRETTVCFHERGATSHFFYTYKCPDSTTSKDDNQDKPGDDEQTRLEKEAAREFDDDPNMENLKLDLGNLTNGVELKIRFNEDTCLYQLDHACIVHNDQLTDIDCGIHNQAAVNHLITEFAAMARKVMNRRDLEIDDFAALWPIYGMNRRANPDASGPNAP